MQVAPRPALMVRLRDTLSRYSPLTTVAEAQVKSLLSDLKLDLEQKNLPASRMFPYIPLWADVEANCIPQSGKAF